MTLALSADQADACETCARNGYRVELPRDAWFDCHRLHSDQLFIDARALGWEASFMLDGNEPHDSKSIAVLDAECNEVCIAKSPMAAAMIAKALEEYWERHHLDGGCPFEEAPCR